MNQSEFFVEVFRYMTAIIGVIGVIALVVTGAMWAKEQGSLFPFWLSLAGLYAAGFSAVLIGIYDRLGIKA